MPNILDKHDDYMANAAKWRRCRDTIEGQDAIHAGGKAYLPRLDGQTDEQYKAYVERARFFNATARTVSGMTGLVMRKDPTIAPEEQPIAEDINHQGVTLDEYGQNVLTEVLSVGRAGTLLDYPRTSAGRTVAQAEAEGATPVFAFYTAESIFNWQYSFVNNRYQLVRVVLYDGVDNSDLSDTDKQVYKYRELVLEDGVYMQRIYTAEDKNAEPVLVANPTGEVGEDGEVLYDNGNIIPLMDGQPLTAIPFVFHSVTGKPNVVDKPPLLDLVDTNVKHYQLKADHAHALHYIALPTPWMTGVDKDNAPTSVGPQRMWVIPNENASVGILEFSGQGLASMREELVSIETQMGQLGSRLLAPEVTQAETATATAIKAMGENSTLGSIVNITNKQMTYLWNMALNWNGTPDEDAVFALNKDFLPANLDAQQLTALVTSWQVNAMSKETLFYNMKQGELIPPDRTFEEEEELIDAEVEKVNEQQNQNNPFAALAEQIAAEDEDDTGDNDADEDE